MFVLSDRRVFVADATAILPSAETPGAYIDYAFRLEFEAIDEEESSSLATLTDEDLAQAAATAPARADKRMLRRIILGWSDVVDRSGQQIPFAADVLEIAIAQPWFRAAAFAAYRAAMTGGEARRGN